MFKFKKVASKNFLSFEEAELNLEERGLVLIEGENRSNQTFTSNGGGKSAYLSQITYALFGQTPSGLKADDVVNRNIGKNMEVILEAEVDGRPYRIERYRKHTKNKNKVKLFLEDEEITGKSAKETEGMIQELFGIDYPTYMNSIVQGQGDSEVFSQATDKGKKEILENITNIAVYKKAQEVAKQESSAKASEMGLIKNAIEKANYEMQSVYSLEQQDKQNYIHTENMIKDTEQAVQEARETLESFENSGDLITLEQRKSELESFEAPTQNTEKSNEEQELETKLVEWKNQASDIRAQIKQGYEKVAGLQEQQTGLDTQTECSLCGAPLDATHAEKEFHRLQVEAEETKANADQLHAVYITQLSPMLAQMEKSLEDMQRDRENDNYNLQSSYNEAQSELYNVKMQINQLHSNIQSQKQNIQTLENTLAQLNHVPKPKERTEEREIIQMKLDEYSKDLISITDKQEQYEEAVKIFSNSGIRSVVLDLVTPYLNERANKYLATLSGSDIEINFTTQVENKDGSLADRFDVEITNNSGGETYKSNSEGEKKRIDLAISFALQDLVLSKSDMQTNVAVYDECFDGLDAVGCENVITILKEKQQQIGSIFVITHNTQLATLFEDSTTVRKENGTSKIV